MRALYASPCQVHLSFRTFREDEKKHSTVVECYHTGCDTVSPRDDSA